jgi:phosphate-selective porin OprO/OprP
MSSIVRRLASLLCMSVAAAFASGEARAAKFELDDGLVWRGDGWRLEFDGRVQIDGASYSSDIPALQSGAEARRIRPSLKLRAGDNWRFRADYEFSDFGTGWKNVYGEYRGLDNWRIRVGNQLAPFGLEQQTGSTNLALLERSLVQALTPGFERGISAKTNGERWMVKAGVFTGNVASNDARRAGGRSVTGRFTFAPVYRDAFSIHLGGSFERRDLKNDELRFSVRPESYVANRRLVDTGALMDASRLQTGGLELALVARRCRLQAERIRSDVELNTSPSAQFEGGYTMIGCLVSGDGYRYRPSSGGIRNPRPSGHMGVLELALRRSYVDLMSTGVTGGLERNWTFGINWQVTEHVRLMSDYVRMDQTPDKNGNDTSGDAVQARFQIAF